MIKKAKDHLKSLYDSRTIIKSLIYKNLIGNYSNSVLGFLWHFVTPVILLIVYYVAFSQLRTAAIDNYWVYLSSGLFPFSFMINNIIGGSSCIVNNSRMIKKMYFPREIIVISRVISTFIVMAIGYLIVIIAVLLSGYGLSSAIWLLPVILIITFIFTLGLVLLLSSITVYVRDFQILLSSISIVFYFLTPMYYMVNSVTGLLKTITILNPLTYFVEAYHSIMYYQNLPDLPSFLIMTIISILSFIIGTVVFCKLKVGFTERL